MSSTENEKEIELQNILLEYKKNRNPKPLKLYLEQIHDHEIMSGIMQKTIMEWIYSKNNLDKFTGLEIMQILIEGAFHTQSSRKFITFGNNLRHLFNTLTVKENALLVLSVETFGLLINKMSQTQTLKTSTAELVDIETKRALEWIEGKEKRLHSVYILEALARNATALFNMHIEKFIIKIWIGVVDKDKNIRITSVKAIEAVLVIIKERTTHHKSHWYHQIHTRIFEGLKSSKKDHIHGSLMVLEVLLKNNPTKVLKGSCDKICQSVYSYHNTKGVKRVVVSIIPKLAQVYGEEFIEKYLGKGLEIMYARLKSPEGRGFVFKKMAELCQIVGDNLKQYVPKLLSIIKEYISISRTKKLTPEALICLSQIIKIMGQDIAKEIEALVDVLAIPLCEEVTNLLKIVIEQYPTMKSSILSRSASLVNNFVEKACQYKDHLNHFIEMKYAFLIIGTFEFRTQHINIFYNNLFEFIRNSEPFCKKHVHTVQYRELRLLAIGSSIHILRKYFQYAISNLDPIIVDDLEYLITLGTTDQNQDIRYHVFKKLSVLNNFDYYLATEASSSMIFMALHDQYYPIRVCAAKILGRLAEINRQQVWPNLLVVVSQFLVQIEYSRGDVKSYTDAVQLMGELAGAFPKFMQSGCFAENILGSLTQKIEDKNNQISIVILNAIGKLAMATNNLNLNQLIQIIPIVINAIRDQSSAKKRRAAVLTLGRIVSSTGFVIEPYTRYPQLLDTLITALVEEGEEDTRIEIIKVFGMIGAVDPYQYNNGRQRTLQSVTQDIQLSPKDQHYNPTVTFQALARILNDYTLREYHFSVIQAVLHIFTSLGSVAVRYLPKIMPLFLNLLRNQIETANSSNQYQRSDILIQQLASLANIVRFSIKPWLPEIFEISIAFFNLHPQNKVHIMRLMKIICHGMKHDLDSSVVNILPLILDVLQKKNNETELTLGFHTLCTLNAAVNPYLQLLIPAIISILNDENISNFIKKEALTTLRILGRANSLGFFVSSIFCSVTQMLRLNYSYQSNDPELVKDIYYTIISIFVSIGINNIKRFYSITLKQLENLPASPEKEEIQNIFYQKSFQTIEDALKASDQKRLVIDDTSNIYVQESKLDSKLLLSSISCDNRSTKEDWEDWMRGFAIQLLRETPSQALRSCFALAEAYFPIAKELFNAAFYNCWYKLLPGDRQEIVISLTRALPHPNLPNETLSLLLNLAEFMERNGQELPIDVQILGALADRCQIYAKSVRYKEREYKKQKISNRVDPQLLDTLTEVYKSVHLIEAARGLLHIQPEGKVRAQRFEKLGQWQKALDIYKESTTPHYYYGVMRCYRGLKQWDKMSEFCSEISESVEDINVKESIARYAARATFMCGDYEGLGKYVNVLPENPNSLFLQAAFQIHKGSYTEAKLHIQTALKLLYPEVSAQVNESYQRGYRNIVRVQQLVEMNEVIEFRLARDNGNQEKMYRIGETWKNRLFGMQRDIATWENILSVRKLADVVDNDTYIKYARIARSEKFYTLAGSVLTQLMVGKNQHVHITDELIRSKPLEVYEYSKYLEEFDPTMKKDTMNLLLKVIEHTRQSNPQVHSRAGLRLVKHHYNVSIEASNALENKNILQKIRDHLSEVVQVQKEYYKAWHEMALFYVNYLSHHYSKLSEKDSSTYIERACTSYFKSIHFSKNSLLKQQDTLRVLTLLCTYPNQCSKTFTSNANVTPPEIWLSCVPQLVARISMKEDKLVHAVHNVLSTLAIKHPQAIVFALSVATHSNDARRQKLSEHIMQVMKKNHTNLVEEAKLVAEELIRISVGWLEVWHHRLEVASTLRSEKKYEMLCQYLHIIHVQMENPQTPDEKQFIDWIRPNLARAYNILNKVMEAKTYRQEEMSALWYEYTQIYYRIQPIYEKLSENTHSLEILSPRLLKAKHLSLRLPSLNSTTPTTISGFCETLNILSSKQKPRVIKMIGADSKRYKFLIKGLEDIRQDERVMQLFGLVNDILSREKKTRNLHMTRYEVVPLNENSGLMEWVEDCDTFHALVIEARGRLREARNDRELQLLARRLRTEIKYVPVQCERITQDERFRLFQEVCNKTKANELEYMLWIRSHNSEIWLTRRTRFVRSLATGSMVGYVLGLGDRHPKNIMLHRVSGQVVHIDFGDCFEAAHERNKWPEFVPFRLTRMLVNAFEVCGTGGTFRSTCIEVMTHLRQNQETLHALLEAFVHDPLFNWHWDEEKKEAGEDEDEKKDTENDELGLPEASEAIYSSTPAYSLVNRSVYQAFSIQNVISETRNEGNGAINEKAVKVLDRIDEKLSGEVQGLNPTDQVDQLIEAATNQFNLAQAYPGWCPFW